MNHNALYVTDLDGTLLGPDSKVSAESARIISGLSRRGALITVATARTPATVEPLLAETRINLPAIVFTGAAEWDLERHCYTHLELMDARAAAEAESICRSCGLTPMRYTIAPDSIIHSYYIGGEPSAAETAFIAERSNLPLKRMHVNSGDVPAGLLERTLMFFAIGPLATTMKAAELLRATGNCSVSNYADIFNPETGFLEVFAAGVSKASAISRMAARLGITDTTVFGDNLNDIPMMQTASHAVAVENAAPEVKRIADTVIGPNSTDSVARYISEQLSKHV